jgi:Leucine-rich repeat (LRR) protein
MTFMVIQKYVNLSRLMVVVAFSAIGLGSCGNGLSVLAAETQSANKTFGDWCREKASLSPEARHTVEVLLKEAGTTECDAANRKLSSLTELDLRGNQISDIKPLQSLTKLTWLVLGTNQISDIKPLQSLTKLTAIELNNNKIIDITPLQSLTNLNSLLLNNNKITDIKPLQSLTKLTWMFLGDNQITDTKPLQSLTSLGVLNLSGNPIAPKTCPLQPESICGWETPFVF